MFGLLINFGTRKIEYKDFTILIILPLANLLILLIFLRRLEIDKKKVNLCRNTGTRKAFRVIDLWLVVVNNFDFGLFNIIRIASTLLLVPMLMLLLA